MEPKAITINIFLSRINIYLFFLEFLIISKQKRLDSFLLRGSNAVKLNEQQGMFLWIIET
jgi:hypothetical protein